MELRHLRSFLAVARERSFTRAANQLHIAQPPLSQRIRELEEYLGVRLLERSTRSVTLTPAGEEFQQRITAILIQLDKAVGECRLTHGGITESLRIGYSRRASHALLPLLIRELRTRYPQVRLDLIGPDSSGALSMELLRGNLDDALCFLPVKERRIRTRELSAL